MHLKQRKMRKISIYKQILSIDESGLVSEALDENSKRDFFAIIRPIDQRRYIDYKTARPRRRLIGFSAEMEGREGDFLKIDNDSTIYKINELRRYEKHIEIEMEALID